MKHKIIVILFSILVLFSSVPSVNAADTDLYVIDSQSNTPVDPNSDNHEEITAVSTISFPDGSQLIIFEATVNTFDKAGGSVTSSKHADYVKDNVTQWSVTLTASFTFNGVSATCTAANSVTHIYQNNWSESSNNTSPSGNSAIANVTLVRKFLFIVVETQNVTLSITCDGNGHVS